LTASTRRISFLTPVFETHNFYGNLCYIIELIFSSISFELYATCDNSPVRIIICEWLHITLAIPNPKNNDVIYKRRVTDQINPFLIENVSTLWYSTSRHRYYGWPEKKYVRENTKKLVLRRRLVLNGFWNSRAAHYYRFILYSAGFCLKTIVRHDCLGVTNVSTPIYISPRHVVVVELKLHQIIFWS